MSTTKKPLTIEEFMDECSHLALTGDEAWLLHQISQHFVGGVEPDVALRYALKLAVNVLNAAYEEDHVQHP
jgi:hypothetical protein